MNIAATTAAEGLPRRVFTVEDVSRMIEAGILREDERFELVEGEIVMMAAKGIAHERMKSALNIAVVRALPDHLTLGVEITLRLTDTVMLEPDIAVFPKDLFKKSQSTFAELRMAEEQVARTRAHEVALPIDLPAVESAFFHPLFELLLCQVFHRFLECGE